MAKRMRDELGLKMIVVFESMENEVTSIQGFFLFPIVNMYEWYVPE
jgi:hypothetical protein